MKLFDIVRMTQDVPALGLCKGMVGAIVDVFGEPAEAYEVEFTDGQGRTIAQAALPPEMIELLAQT